ncbi:MAG: hypothetical protein ACRDJ9_21580 [Dehalococcoidia bacterium]
MTGEPWRTRLIQAFSLVLGFCIAIRICWYLVEPLLAPLGVIVILLAIGYLLFAGPRYRG